MKVLSVVDYLSYLEDVTERFEQEKDYITYLDATLGDGDHWANLMIGFDEIKKRKAELESLSFENLFKQIAKILMSSAGGSSGILYASAYLYAAKLVAGKETISAEDLPNLFEAEYNGIADRGKAKPGEKTMLDTLCGAVQGGKKSASNEEKRLLNVLHGAEEGMLATKDMRATKGRACYRLDKGEGYLDPGAVTMYYQVELLVKRFL